MSASMSGMRAGTESDSVSQPQSGSYRDLIAWRKAMDLVVGVYAETARLPVEERFGLALQMRRAAVSIPSNIAEGWGRGPTPDFTRFLRIARGSILELSTQVEICTTLGFPGDWEAILGQADEVRKILQGLINSRDA